MNHLLATRYYNHLIRHQLRSTLLLHPIKCKQCYNRNMTTVLPTRFVKQNHLRWQIITATQHHQLLVHFSSASNTSSSSSSSSSSSDDPFHDYTPPKISMLDSDFNESEENYDDDQDVNEASSFLLDNDDTENDDPSFDTHGKVHDVASDIITEATTAVTDDDNNSVLNNTLENNSSKISPFHPLQQQQPPKRQRNQSRSRFLVSYKDDPNNGAPIPTVSYSVPTRTSSLVEERVASQRLSQMEETTQHILNQKTFHTVEVCIEDLHHLYLYWLSRPVRDMFYHKDYDTYHPLQRADALLQWFMYQFDHVASNDDEKHIVANALYAILSNTGESMNTGLCRLMTLFSQPLQGTNSALKDHGRRQDDNMKRHVENLLSASRIHQLMERMHKDNVYFPNINPDAQSYQSIINLYGKRCKLLVLLGPPPQTEGLHFPRIRRGIRWSDPTTIAALGGCRSSRDCIECAKNVISEMKQNESCPNPSMIHYSVLLSMMSYSAGLNIGMADEAYALLQELINDPTIEDSIALYNPVLLAYVMEADEHKKRQRWEQQRILQRKCENLWDQMRHHPNPTISCEPISFSIMIKLYRNLDEASKAQDILESMEAAAVHRSSLSSTTSETSSEVTNGIVSNIDTASVSTKSLPPDPSLMHYNTVLNAWAKSSDPNSGERALTLVRRMEQQSLAMNGLHHPIVPRPDHVSFTSTLDALLRGPNVKVTIAQMEQILQRFESYEEIERRPDVVTYNVIFHSLHRQLCAQSEMHVKVQIAEEMEQLLHRLKKNSTNFRMVAGPRIFRYYNDCIRAWSMTNTDESPNRAMSLLRDMEEVRTNGTFPAARPNGTTYQYVISVLSRSSDQDYIKLSKELFTKMEDADVPVTVTALLTYLGRLLRVRFDGTIDEADNAFIETLMERFRAKLDRNDAFVAGMVLESIFTHINKETDIYQKISWVRRYEKLFRALVKEPQLLRLNNEGQNMTYFYNSCIKVWAFARTTDSTANSLRILREMEDLCRTTNLPATDLLSCYPNVKTFEYILTCLTRTPDLISVNTARDIFHKMEIANIPISLSILNRFIRILSNSCTRGALAEAEHLLKIVEDDYLAGREGSLCPNFLSYSFLVEGHMRSREGLRDAERIIDHMKVLSEKHGMTELRPSPKLYVDLINRWSESLEAEAIERVDSLFRKMAEISKPSHFEYATLQSAWSRSKRPDAPQHVESILVMMKEEYDKGSNPSARPAVENFDLVIKAWATSLQPGSVERADAILQRLEELCYAERGAYSNLRPTTSCYQHALLGWTLVENPEAGERALAILDRMRRYQTLTRGAPSINQACYHHTIVAIGKSTPNNHKAAKCYSLLGEMRLAYETRRNRYSWPTHETFRSILGVCATCTESKDEQEEALEVSVKTMKEYLQISQMQPRKDVYVQFLYAIFRLIPAGAKRDNIVFSIFADDKHKCPAEIFDSMHVRDALAKTVSPKVLADIARTCGRNPLLKSLNRVRFN
jgi:hypothetical protein